MTYKEKKMLYMIHQINVLTKFFAAAALHRPTILVFLQKSFRPKLYYWREFSCYKILPSMLHAGLLSQIYSL